MAFQLFLVCFQGIYGYQGDLNYVFRKSGQSKLQKLNCPRNNLENGQSDEYQSNYRARESTLVFLCISLNYSGFALCICDVKLNFSRESLNCDKYPNSVLEIYCNSQDKRFLGRAKLISGFVSRGISGNKEKDFGPRLGFFRIYIFPSYSLIKRRPIWCFVCLFIPRIFVVVFSGQEMHLRFSEIGTIETTKN